MKSKLVLLLTILVCFILQGTVLQVVAVGEITPNLLLILCVSMGLMRGKKSGLFTGFFCGLLYDLFYSPLLGFYALLYMYVGFLSGYCCKVYYDDDVKVPLLLVAGGDFLFGVAVYILQFLLRGRTDFLFYLSRIIIPEILYTLLLTAIIYRIFYKINYRFMRVKRTKERDSLWLEK